MTKLEKILIEKGLKQSWLAKKINKSPAEVNRWVKGRVIPVYVNMNKISKALSIPIEQIFYKEGAEVRANSAIISEVSEISAITSKVSMNPNVNSEASAISNITSRVSVNPKINSEASAISNITSHDDGMGDEKQLGNI